jgi:hypothetical protein
MQAACATFNPQFWRSTMTILKPQCDTEFAQYPNALVQNPHLLSDRTHKAVMHLLSLPPDWEVHPEKLTKRLGCSLATIRRIFGELQEKGFAKKIYDVVNGKLVVVDWEIRVPALPPAQDAQDARDEVDEDDRPTLDIEDLPEDAAVVMEPMASAASRAAESDRSCKSDMWGDRSCKSDMLVATDLSNLQRCTSATDQICNVAVQKLPFGQRASFAREIRLGLILCLSQSPNQRLPLCQASTPPVGRGPPTCKFWCYTQCARGRRGAR